MTHLVTYTKILSSYEDTYQVSKLDWYYYFDDTVQIMFFDTIIHIVYKNNHVFHLYTDLTSACTPSTK